MARIRTKVTWDYKKLQQRYTAVLTDVAEDLSPQLKLQFEKEVYAWKGPNFETRRKNGEVVTEPRNIVDTGALRDSQKWSIRKATTLLFSWGGGFVNYAGAVFFGVPYAGANGPGRDWVTPVLNDYPLGQRVATFWKKYAGG